MKLVVWLVCDVGGERMASMGAEEKQLGPCGGLQIMG